MNNVNQNAAKMIISSYFLFILFGDELETDLTRFRTEEMCVCDSQCY